MPTEGFHCGFLHCTFNLPPGHCEPVTDVTGVAGGNALGVWQSAPMHRGFNLPMHQRSSTGAQQARSGGEPVEENAFPLMNFRGVDRQLPNEQCPDAALEHRRWLEFGLGTNAKVPGTNTSRRRRQPHNKRRFQRTKGPLACLSPYSFFTKRKSMCCDGGAKCRRRKCPWGTPGGRSPL